MDVNGITRAIIECAIELHRRLGPGLLESVYEHMLAKLLDRKGFKVERQKAISVDFDGERFENAFKVDLLVNNLVVVEIKAVEKMSRVYARQVLTYLKLLDLRVGLLINFGGATLIEGVERIMNGYLASAVSVSPDLCVENSPGDTMLPPDATVRPPGPPVAGA